MTLKSGVDLALDKILLGGEPNQFEVRQKPIPAPRRRLLERQTPPPEPPSAPPRLPPLKTPLLQRKPVEMRGITKEEFHKTTPLEEESGIGFQNPPDWVKAIGDFLTPGGITNPRSLREVATVVGQSAFMSLPGAGVPLRALGIAGTALKVADVIDIISNPFAWKGGLSQLAGKGGGKLIPKKGKIIPGKVTPVTPEVTKPIISPSPEVAQSADPLFREAMDDFMSKIIPAQKLARKATTQLYKEARTPAFGEVEEVLKFPKGEATVKEATEKLGIGQLPRAEFDTEAIQKLMTQPKKDAIFNNLAENANIPKPIDRLNAMIAMKRILSPAQYIIDHPKLALDIPPNTPFRPFELKLFEQAWGKKWADQVAEATLKMANKPVGIDSASRDYLMGLSDKQFKQLGAFPTTNRAKVLNMFSKAGINAIDFFGIPKALKFSFDVSYMFRQLIISGARHPIEWAKTWKPYIKALRSEEVALKLDNEIKTDPELIQAMSKMTPDFYDIRKGASYWGRPESMASKFAERFVPGVRMSNRGAAVALNHYLAGVTKSTYKVMNKMGAGDEEYRAMSSLFNELVGRGEMPTALKGNLGALLNDLLSSPRYVASRFEWPTKLFSSSKIVRQEASSTLVAWVGLMSSIIGVAYAAGVKVEFDPRSSDAYKIRIGNKRIDVWVGYAQIVRLLAQLATSERKTAEGKIVPITRAQVLGRYAQSKESPGIGALVTLLSGTNYVGKKLDLKTLRGIGKFTKETFAPASLEEMVDAYAIEGAQSAALSGIGLVGVSVSTYESQAKPVSPPIPPSEKPRISGGGRFKGKLKLKTQQ